MSKKIISDFIEKQQKFISGWYESPESEWNKSPFQEFTSLGKKLMPCIEYMPEPYLGHPENADAVLINYNPGPPIENLQKWKDGDFLIKYNISSNYHDFAQNTSYFDLKTGFWRLRKNLVGRLLEKESDKTNLFALEICPWHSNKFSLNKQEELLISDYFEKELLPVAEAAARISKIGTVITIGEKIQKIFQNIGFKKEKELSYLDNVDGWPKNKHKENTKRFFALWTSPNGVKFLSTWAQGGNRTPSPAFDPIIKKFLD